MARTEKESVGSYSLWGKQVQGRVPSFSRSVNWKGLEDGRPMTAVSPKGAYV